LDLSAIAKLSSSPSPPFSSAYPTATPPSVPSLSNNKLFYAPSPLTINIVIFVSLIYNINSEYLIKFVSLGLLKMIYTIGYEERTLEEFIEQLKLFNISTLVDIRENPFSRKKGFSKNALAQSLEENGIEYLHLTVA